MNRLQYTTMAVMSGITGMLAFAALLLVVQSNRQKLRKKDQQLLAREELFSNLSRNVDDVFLMIDTETSKAEYVLSLIHIWQKEKHEGRNLRAFLVGQAGLEPATKRL